MKETSLDEFVTGGEDADESAEPDGEDEAVDKPVDEAQTGEKADIEPATSTAQWSPDGTACESCGEPVERLWVDDGRRVCGDCKQWG